MKTIDLLDQNLMQRNGRRADTFRPEPIKNHKSKIFAFSLSFFVDFSLEFIDYYPNPYTQNHVETTTDTSMLLLGFLDGDHGVFSFSKHLFMSSSCSSKDRLFVFQHVPCCHPLRQLGGYLRRHSPKRARDEGCQPATPSTL